MLLARAVLNAVRLLINVLEAVGLLDSANQQGRVGGSSALGPLSLDRQWRERDNYSE